MNFSKLAKKVGLAALLGATTLSSAAPITGNVKWFQSDARQPNSPGTFESYPEVNAWYTLPGNINGFSFLDVYANTSDTYFGKTTLTKKIAGNLSAATQIRYIGEPLTDAGLGIKFAIPVKNGYGSISILPVWLDKDGRREDKQIYGFAFGKDLGHGISFESFGEMKHVAGHFKWSYGEGEANKTVFETPSGGKVKLGVSVALQPYGKSKPKPEFRAVVRYDWKLGRK